MTLPAIQDLVKKSFVKEAHKEGGDVRMLFMPKNGSWESSSIRVHEVDRERFAEQKVEGQKSAQRGVSQGYYKDISRKTISITRKTSGEASHALTAHDLAIWAQSVAKDVVDKIELDMRNFLGYATGATSYVDNGGFTIDLTVGDGLAVFNSTHTLKQSSTTYSNILSGAPSLSESALESGEDYFNYNVMDNYAQRVEMKATHIITSNSATMKNRVARLLRSSAPESIEGTGNNNPGVVNTYRDKFRHLVIEFDVTALNAADSTKKFYWFLASLTGLPEERFQAYYVRWLRPTVAPAEVDQDAWVVSATARACYGLGAVSGKGILVAKATS